MNLEDFYEGREFESYEYFGAHKVEKGYIFRTYAPNAKKVALIGEFHSYREDFMIKSEDGIYEITIEDARPGMKYLYRIYQEENNYCDHCDPYGFSMELRPGYASVICDRNTYSFQDAEWMKNRAEETRQMPMTIYEVHLGSFGKKDGFDGFYSYQEIAEQLVSHVKQCGYNYIEFLPLAEHPLDESLGYQNTGFFAPTSRFGEPDGLRYLVDLCHQNQIGVIMDCAMVSFAIDRFGLADYDGQPLYEYGHKDSAINQFGSLNFIHAKGYVRSFLQSAAYYWLKEFHFDGLHFGSMSRLIYWHGEKHRGENGIAIDFLKCMNLGLKQRIPECILMTGGTGGFLKTTDTVANSGLGFDYQWDANWMEDVLKYLSYTPNMRKKQYYILPFSMIYFREEHYMLALSHDGALHRDKGLLDGIYGSEKEKIRQTKVLLMYMYAHPGKVLNFSGMEVAAMEQWDCKKEYIKKYLKQTSHRKFMKFMSKLNEVYKSEEALYVWDYKEEGFSWVDCKKDGTCMYTFCRRGAESMIYAVFNFEDQEVKDYSIPIKNAIQGEVIFNSNEEEDDMDAPQREKRVILKAECGVDGNVLKITVPAYSGIYIKV